MTIRPCAPSLSAIKRRHPRP